MPRRYLSNVALSSLHGKTTKLAADPGKILLLNLWASWCAACRTELPMLEKIQAALHYRVFVIAVSTDQPKANDVSNYLNSLGVARLIVLTMKGIFRSRGLVPIHGFRCMECQSPI
jgi:thiol-disulfide isomerase/thioredoxin